MNLRLSCHGDDNANVKLTSNQEQHAENKDRGTLDAGNDSYRKLKSKNSLASSDHSKYSSAEHSSMLDHGTTTDEPVQNTSGSLRTKRSEIIEKISESNNPGYSEIQGRSAQGFSAMRGRRDQGFSLIRGRSAQGYVPIRGRRDQGFSAMRGRSLQGFSAMRGRSAQGFSPIRGRSLQGFSAMRGRRDQGFSPIRGRRTQGFSAIRGRALPEGGFSAMRGRREQGFSPIRGRSAESFQGGFSAIRGKRLPDGSEEKVENEVRESDLNSLSASDI